MGSIKVFDKASKSSQFLFLTQSFSFEIIIKQEFNDEKKCMIIAC